MYKKLNLSWKKFLPLLFIVSSLICFAVPLHAQEVHPWTVMVYMAADSTDDSWDTAIADFEKLSEIGSSDSVAVVVILGDADAQTAKYGIVNYGDSYETWGEFFGEVVDMGDTQTLIDFVNGATYVEGGYPAENYALILWNAAELYPNEKLSIKEVANALSGLQIPVNGYEDIHINLIGFDGGPMGMLEAAYEIKDYADVMVASEKNQPLGTWPYTDILDELVSDTGMTPDQLGAVMVKEYDQSDNDQTLSAVLLAKYSTYDLAGEWVMYGSRCSGAENCEISIGMMNVNERGDIEWLWLDEYDEMDSVPAKAYVFPKRYIPETEVEVEGLVLIVDEEEQLLPFVGTMSQDKNMVVANVDDEENSYNLIVLQKRGSETLTVADLAGKWNMHSFRCNDSNGSCGWSRGVANVTPGGVMTWDEFGDSGTTDENEATHQFSVGSYESVSNVISIDGKPFGTMSKDEGVIIGTTGGESEEQLIILQKQGTGFDDTDLEGVWNAHFIGCDYFSGDGGIWNYDGEPGVVTMSPNEGGIYAGDLVGVGNFKVLIDENGVVSIENCNEGCFPLPSFHGTMSLDKSMIVMNGGEGDGADTSYQFIILQKVRATSPIEDLAEAVSDFADAALDEEINHDDRDVIFAAQQRAGRYTIDDAGEIVFRDLGSFMQGVSDYANSDTIFQYAYDTKEAFAQCIIAEHGSSEDNGLSIYFPKWYWDYGKIDTKYGSEYLSFLYDIYDNGASYLQYWDEFLDYYVDAEPELVPSHTGENVTFSRGISGGTSASDYVMISSPVWSDVDDPLVDDLGDYDTQLWRCYRWDPELEPAAGYEEYPFTAEYGEYVIPKSAIIGDYITQGKGYWLISRNDVTLDITGSLQGTDYPWEIELAPGWNQIGTPFNFEIDCDMVEVRYQYCPEGCEEYFYNVSSNENVYTSKVIWEYSGGGYRPATSMKPGEGYWIYNYNEYSNVYIYLEINPVRHTLFNDYVPSLQKTLTMFAKASGEETPPPPPGGVDGESGEEGGSGSGGGSGCFIATACFGSALSGEVSTLRSFRDTYLLSNPVGQLFVSTYYRYSPKIADFIAKHDFLKFVVRSTLYPVVKGCGLTVED